MKTATVPAQITTVEDKIVGNLTLQQLLMLGGPTFVDFAFYTIVPPTLKLNIYKFTIMIVVTLGSSLLAVRIKGKIVLEWTITIFRYNSRPRYFVFNKNNIYMREQQIKNHIDGEDKVTNKKKTAQKNVGQISQEDVIKVESIFRAKSANLNFVANKRGRLYVSTMEVEQ